MSSQLNMINLDKMPESEKMALLAKLKQLEAQKSEPKSSTFKTPESVVLPKPHLSVVPVNDSPQKSLKNLIHQNALTLIHLVLIPKM